MLRHIAALTILLVASFAYAPQIAVANHGQLPHWVNESRDQSGNGCCGEADCIPVGFAYVLGEKEGKMLVSIEGNVGLISSRRFKVRVLARPPILNFSVFGQPKPQWKLCKQKLKK